MIKNIKAKWNLIEDEKITKIDIDTSESQSDDEETETGNDYTDDEEESTDYKMI